MGVWVLRFEPGAATGINPAVLGVWWTRDERAARRTAEKHLESIHLNPLAPGDSLAEDARPLSIPGVEAVYWWASRGTRFVMQRHDVQGAKP